MTIDVDSPADRHDNNHFVDTVMPCIEQIRRRAQRLTASGYDADDLLQETLLKAYSGFHTFEPGSNARAWLFRIMYNNWVTTYRMRQRGVSKQLCEDFSDWQLSAEARHTSAGLRSAEVEAIEAMRDDEIADALSAIPAVNRVTVYLADVEGYPYREIACLMGTPIGTVMSRLARGRKRLRELLSEVAKDRGLLRTQAAGPIPRPQ
ncbi:sigma-70 family RNA polymerase sigma factor [Mycolicibacterium peregrinum]|uniref:sigma-70 family RNA polymerase sigma factor n=1 Tax=Mycolicibacterium peregrinum TaxID=43304 RepID=UPI0006D84793|nr:sigma-70 family RNA polymerase sigma factor [Mycolicibacterium peregrinum]ORW53657.1 RNA polymerase subunit sigma-70 [Mycolicibacterium peregrinum]